MNPFSITSGTAINAADFSRPTPCAILSSTPFKSNTTSPNSSLRATFPIDLKYAGTLSVSFTPSFWNSCPVRFATGAVLSRKSMAAFAQASFSQSPNHFLKLGVLTRTHCSSVKFVRLPFGAFIHKGVPMYLDLTSSYCFCASDISSAAGSPVSRQRRFPFPASLERSAA